MNELKLHDNKKKTNLIAPVFTDGMIVNAEDLTAAMRYPLDLFQTVIRASFGCGIVCGLRVYEHPKDATSTRCVKVEPGVALDCNGYPLQLCDVEVINFTPDPCACDDPPRHLCIAIRRETAKEMPSEDGDDCDDGGKSRCQCRRAREIVQVKVFTEDDLPEALCARPRPPETPSPDDAAGDAPPAPEGEPEPEPTVQEIECDCLKTCSDCCGCCEPSWVLLACVEVDECGRILKIDNERRKYIKPIGCNCVPEKPFSFTPVDADDTHDGDGGDHDDRGTGRVRRKAGRRTKRTPVR